jgi:hypothetical protein
MSVIEHAKQELARINFGEEDSHVMIDSIIFSYVPSGCST